MSQRGLRVEFTIPRPRKRHDETPAPKDPVPRIARLLALAHKWEGMVRRGEVKDYAEIARLMRLSRARVTQICQLTLLSARVQESLLTHAPEIPSNLLRERGLRRTGWSAVWSQQEENLPVHGLES